MLSCILAREIAFHVEGGLKWVKQLCISWSL
jgi:hypothetical protein